MLSMLGEIRSFFNDFMQLDDVIALFDIIPSSLKILIVGGVAFSIAIATKRSVIG